MTLSRIINYKNQNMEIFSTDILSRILISTNNNKFCIIYILFCKVISFGFISKTHN